MKSIKVLIAAVALCVMASAPALQAQGKKGAPTPEQQIERIDAAVGGLTAAQKTKITDIIAKTREDMQGVPKEERKSKMADAMKKQHADIRAVLTPDQQSKYDTMPQGGGKRKKDQ